VARKAKKIPASLGRWYQLQVSRFIYIGECESVCLALGPYRNLTTLTAATLSLHPQVQVLNHGGGWIYGNDRVDFLSAYSRQKFDRFVQYAIRMSAAGERGDHGGSIEHSHAFDEQHGMKSAYCESGAQRVKPTVKCLFWKESLRTSNRLRDCSVDMGRLIKAEPRLRFMMPVRNPLDCAVSNLKTGHISLFRGLDEGATMEEAVDAVLSEIREFAAYRQAFPERFFWYFEHSISRQMLLDMARFLAVAPDADWLDRSLTVMQVNSGYAHDEALLDYYRAQAGEIFADLPELRDALLEFF
jgi:hypothetical protein